MHSPDEETDPESSPKTSPETSTETSPVATLSRTSEDDLVPSAFERAKARAFDHDPVIAWASTVGLTLIAFLLRWWNLGLNKPQFLFDETYYAKDAWSLIHNGYVRNYAANADQQIISGNTHGLWTDGPSMIVHPEVGKWLIGLGEWINGMNPEGWRLMPAVIGSLMVFVMIRLARRVTGSTLLGLVAGVLMTFDGLQFVLSRLALLDIFQAFFLLCAVSCMVADRDWFRARLARTVDHEALAEYNRRDRVPTDGEKRGGPWGPRILFRPWLLTASLWWGLSIGTKWSSIYPLAAFGLLYWFWNAGARRSFGIRLPILKAAVMDALPGVVYIVVIPVLVYIATWTGWLMHSGAYDQYLAHNQYGPYWGDYTKRPAHGFGQFLKSLHSLWNYHKDVWKFHTSGLNTAHHVYQSNPLGWPVLNRPVGVDAQLDIQPGAQGCSATGTETCLRQVLLLGTPVLWWFSTVALIWSAVLWIGKRDWRYGIVVAGALTTWLPWLRFDDRPIFSFYAINMEPFLILGAVLLLGQILGRPDASRQRRKVGAIFAGTIVVAVVVNFAWFYPIYTDGLLTQSQWLQRIWFHRWI